MRTIKSILIVLLLIIGLSSCGNNINQDNDIKDTKNTSSIESQGDLTENLLNFIDKITNDSEYLINVNCDETEKDVIDYCKEAQDELIAYNLNGGFVDSDDSYYENIIYSTGVTDFINVLMENPGYIKTVNCDDLDTDVKAFCMKEQEDYLKSFSEYNELTLNETIQN